MKDKGIGLNTMALEHLSDDLRHRQVLENPLIVTELQVVQRWHQGQVIAGQACAGLADPDIFDPPVDAFAIQAKLKERGLTEQAFQIEVRVLADQLDLDCVQGTDRFSTVKGQYLEIVVDRRDH
ncbi:hypothetical protein D9M71_763210 [compost metagenome]